MKKSLKSIFALTVLILIASCGTTGNMTNSSSKSNTDRPQKKETVNYDQSKVKVKQKAAFSKQKSSVE